MATPAGFRPFSLVLTLLILLNGSVQSLDPMENGERTYDGNYTVSEELLPGLYEELWGDDIIVDTNYGQLSGKRRIGFPEAGNCKMGTWSPGKV